MAWLPAFLDPYPAMIAAAIVVPALLVLYFLKLRRRELVVSSTLLWRKAAQDLQVNSPFQKLRRNLLLLLQMLLLSLLCLALAKPVMKFTAGAGHLTVILIDRSASMSALENSSGHSSTRLDEAKRQAKALVDTMQRGAFDSPDSATVIVFDDSAEIAVPWTTDRTRLKAAIDAIQPTDRKSRLKIAYKLAEAQTVYFTEQMRANERPAVFLYSDGRVADGDELSLRGDLHYQKIGGESAVNVAIVALSAKRNYERPSEVQIFGRLANFGPEPVSTDVRLTVNGEGRGTASDLLLLPERWNDPNFPDEKKDKSLLGKSKSSFAFPRLELTTSGVIRVEQTHPDALGADDTATVLIPPPKTMSVLLVTEGNYYLDHALHSIGLQNPDTLNPVAYEELKDKASKYDVIVFDRYVPKLLPPNANFIWFGAVPAGASIKQTVESGQPSVYKNSTVLDWKRDHPALRGISFNRLFVSEGLKLELSVQDEVLVEGTKAPLIVLHHEGRSTHLVVSFDAMQGNFPLRPMFPIFMRQAIQYLAMGVDMDVRESFAPGSTPRIPRAALQKVSADLKELTITGPMGKMKVSIPDVGEVALPALNKVGVYELIPPVPGFERFAVNLLDENESNLMAVDRPPGGLGETVTSKAGKSRLELWWWIVALGALPLLLIEWWVYTRRVHLQGWRAAPGSCGLVESMRG